MFGGERYCTFQLYCIFSYSKVWTTTQPKPSVVMLKILCIESHQSVGNALCGIFPWFKFVVKNIHLKDLIFDIPEGLFGIFP